MVVGERLVMMNEFGSLRGMLVKRFRRAQRSNGVRWVCTGQRCRWSGDICEKGVEGKRLGVKIEHTMALH